MDKNDVEYQRIYRLACDVLSDSKSAEDWLKTSKEYFRGLTPEEVAKIDPEPVRRVLGRIMEVVYSGSEFEISEDFLERYNQTLRKKTAQP